jgi:hypothetical protein
MALMPLRVMGEAESGPLSQATLADRGAACHNGNRYKEDQAGAVG